MKPLLLLTISACAFAAQPLLLISVDGLDQRYLSKRDEYGLKIPNIRRLIREGQMSSGVVGVVPTITWPSHTTLITGVDPQVHGILSNRRPASEGGDYPWSVSLLKVPTLLDVAHKAGLKTAAVTWPVTVDGPIDFNLPEYFQKRRGGMMDLRSIESKSNPKDLVDRIAKMFPSFRQEWMDDRTRTQAVVYMLKAEKPDLTIVHLVDLDSEQHDNAPFTPESYAMLEYTDELIGQMMAAAPKNCAIALVSDHGFERVETDVNVSGPGVRAMGGMAVAQSVDAASGLRGRKGVGREIPKEEVLKYAPQFASAAAVFEPAPGYMFNSQSKEEFSKPHEIGNHGFWPTRYRAVYVLWGAKSKPGETPEISQKEIAGRLAGVLGVKF